MGNWLLVDHCVICDDHATALRIYERLELVEVDFDLGPSGIRWGFFDERVLVVTTTSKWGSQPGFLRPLLDDLPGVRCITRTDDAEDEDDLAFEAIRAALGAERDFVWCDREPMMQALLDMFEPHPTTLTTLALVPGPRARSIALPESAREPYPSRAHGVIVHGFITRDGGCFALGNVSSGGDLAGSLSWTPLVAARTRGSGAWALHNVLDGNALLPPHVEGDAWRLERHAPHGLWLCRSARIAHASAALSSTVPEERQAGCSLARRWDLRELDASITTLTRDANEHVRAAAEAALVRRAAPPAPIEPTVRDVTAQASPRWAEATRGDPDDDALVRRTTLGCVELAVLRRSFLRHCSITEAMQRAFAARVGELAWGITQTSYFMVRYGVMGEDAPPRLEAIEDEWDGKDSSAGDRILHWAARAIEASRDPHPKRAALRTFVAFDELLLACRANRVWWLPPIGLVHADLEDLLAGREREVSLAMPGAEELAWLIARVRATPYPDVLPTFERDCTETLARTPSPRDIAPYSQYGRSALPLICWLANNLAWHLFEAGALERALPYAQTAAACATWDDDQVHDTVARILLALGRTDAPS